MNGSGMPTSQVSARFTEFIPISRRDNRLLQLWFQGREACSIHCWLLAAQATGGSFIGRQMRTTTVFHRTRAK
jgi:hypothetical protein